MAIQDRLGRKVHWKILMLMINTDTAFNFYTFHYSLYGAVIQTKHDKSAIKNSPLYKF